MEMTNNIKELETEKEFIMGCATNFGSFLKYNALVPYNDAFKDYIDKLIENEEGKPERSRNQEQIKKLKQDKKIYKEKKKVLDKSNTINGDQFKIKDIFQMRDALVELKHNGRKLKDALGIICNII